MSLEKLTFKLTSNHKIRYEYQPNLEPGDEGVTVGEQSGPQWEPLFESLIKTYERLKELDVIYIEDLEGK